MYFMRYIDTAEIKLTFEERKRKAILSAKTLYDKLLIATEFGDIPLAEELLSQNVPINPDSSSHVSTPLFQAVIRNQYEMVKFLLKRGANVDQPSPSNGFSLPLHGAVNNKDMFNLLIENGADVNKVNPFSKGTALHEAIFLARYQFDLAVSVIEELLKLNADIAEKDQFNRAPIDLIECNKETWSTLKSKEVAEQNFAILFNLLTTRAKKKFNLSIYQIRQTILYIISTFEDDKPNYILQYLDHSYWIEKILKVLTDLLYQDSISFSDVSPLINLLEARWQFIVIASPNDRYTVTPHSKINAICMALAQYLEPISGFGRYKLLMPTIRSSVSNITLTEFADPTLSLHEIIEEEGNNTFIEVLSCFEYAVTTGKLCYTTLVTADKATELEDTDKDRVINQSKETKALWEAICQKEIIRTKGESFGTALTHLVNKLSSGGAHAGKDGTETQAGKDANEGILQFSDWFGSLKEEEQKCLNELSSPLVNENFGRIWSRISNPKDITNTDIKYCVEILASKIRGIISSNKQIFDIYPANCKQKRVGSFIEAEELVKNRFAELKSVIKSQNYNMTGRYRVNDVSFRLFAQLLFERADLYKFGNRASLSKILLEYPLAEFKKWIASQLGGVNDIYSYRFLQLLRDGSYRILLSRKLLALLHLINHCHVEIFINSFKKLYLEFNDRDFDLNEVKIMFDVHRTGVLNLKENIMGIFIEHFHDEIMRCIKLNGIQILLPLENSNMTLFVIKHIFSKYPELIGKGSGLVNHINYLEVNPSLLRSFYEWLVIEFIPEHKQILSNDDILHAMKHVNNKILFMEYFKPKKDVSIVMPAISYLEKNTVFYLPTNSQTSTLQNAGLHSEQREFEQALKK